MRGKNESFSCIRHRYRNTEIIARAIASAIPGADLKKLPTDVNSQNYDFIFAGFWCDKGTPDEVWQAFQKEAKTKPLRTSERWAEIPTANADRLGLTR